VTFNKVALNLSDNRAGNIMVFNSKDNQVEALTLQANIHGLELLAPQLDNSTVSGYTTQKVFSFFDLARLNIVDSNITGLPAVRAFVNEAFVVDRCSFSNMALFCGGPSGRGSLSALAVNVSLHSSIITATSTHPGARPNVTVTNTVFSSIKFTTWVPGARQSLLYMRGSDNMTFYNVTVKDVWDLSGQYLDMFYTEYEYSGRVLPKLFNMSLCRIENVAAANILALQAETVHVHNCSIDNATLRHARLLFMVPYWQEVDINNSNFSNIALGSAAEATELMQDYYTPGVGVVKTASVTKASIVSCVFTNISTLPGKDANFSSTRLHPQTAVVAAGSEVAIRSSQFIDCYTSCAVMAYSGSKEVLGQVYSQGTANRGDRPTIVTAVVDECTFNGNVYGVFADSFQVHVLRSSFNNSIVEGIHVSGVSCLVVNGTNLVSAPVAIQRASNPGGTEFGLCIGGNFSAQGSTTEVWQPYGEADEEAVAHMADAAAVHGLQRTDLSILVPSATSVVIEGVNITGVKGIAPLSMSDVHKASLQRVRIFDNAAAVGAAVFNSVAGLLLLECRFERNRARVQGMAGGATFVAVADAILLNTSFVDNVGLGAGGLLLRSCGAITINSCIFKSNTVLEQGGGGIHAIDTQSMTLATNIYKQPEEINCLQLSAEEGEYYEGIARVCRKADFGGRATVFDHNVAQEGSGGGLLVEGLTLAAWNATEPIYKHNRCVGDPRRKCLHKGCCLAEKRSEGGALNLCHAQ
jgi:hypothetical protein